MGYVEMYRLRLSLLINVLPGGYIEEELSVSCTRPTAEVEQQAPEEHAQPTVVSQGVRPMIQIGKKAPDFTAPAYFNGGFTSAKLSDHLGKWVVLCFYPGDFTFV